MSNSLSGISGRAVDQLAAGLAQELGLSRQVQDVLGAAGALAGGDLNRAFSGLLSQVDTGSIGMGGSFAAALAGLASGSPLGLAAFAKDALGIGGKGFEGLGQLGESLGKGLEGLASGLGDAVGHAAEGLGEALGGIGDAIGDAVGAVGDAIGDALGGKEATASADGTAGDKGDTESTGEAEGASDGSSGESGGGEGGGGSTK